MQIVIKRSFDAEKATSGSSSSSSSSSSFTSPFPLLPFKKKMGAKKEIIRKGNQSAGN